MKAYHIHPISCLSAIMEMYLHLWCKVPQGSTLRPIFLIYLNDLFESSSKNILERKK